MKYAGRHFNSASCFLTSFIHTQNVFMTCCILWSIVRIVMKDYGTQICCIENRTAEYLIVKFILKINIYAFVYFSDVTSHEMAPIA